LKIASIAFTLAISAALTAPVMAREQQVTVYAKNFAFTPGTITLKVHQRAKLVFVGKQGMHGITIPEIGINNVVNIGSSPSIVEVTPTKVGNFVARCAVFCGVGHARMILQVHVVK